MAAKQQASDMVAEMVQKCSRYDILQKSYRSHILLYHSYIQPYHLHIQSHHLNMQLYNSYIQSYHA